MVSPPGSTTAVMIVLYMHYQPKAHLRSFLDALPPACKHQCLGSRYTATTAKHTWPCTQPRPKPRSTTKVNAPHLFWFDCQLTTVHTLCKYKAKCRAMNGMPLWTHTYFFITEKSANLQNIHHPCILLLTKGELFEVVNVLCA